MEFGITPSRMPQRKNKLTDDELRNIVASTAKAVEANSTANAELRQEIRELRNLIAEQQVQYAEQRAETHEQIDELRLAIARAHRDFLETRDALADAIGQTLRGIDRLRIVSDQQQQTLNYLLKKEEGQPRD